MALLLIPDAVNKILDRGRREGREQAREESRREGREQGREEGREQGREEGRKAERDRIRQIMQDHGVPLTPEQDKFLFGES